MSVLCNVKKSSTARTTAHFPSSLSHRIGSPLLKRRISILFTIITQSSRFPWHIFVIDLVQRICVILGSHSHVCGRGICVALPQNHSLGSIARKRNLLPCVFATQQLHWRVLIATAFHDMNTQCALVRRIQYANWGEWPWVGRFSRIVRQSSRIRQER